VSEDRFDQAIAKIDAANAEDPNRETWEGVEYPKELIYAQRMTAWLDKLAPDAPEHLRLAARSQHIRRWVKPRDAYPRDRKGYHLWRTELYSFHADEAAEILRGVGYDDATIELARDLLLKKNIKSNPEMQLLEDVICLVFLEFYFADFAPNFDEEKMITILQRTWKKMSERGHEEALKLDFSPEAIAVIQKALA
jgi:hypothetical protein